MKAKYKAKKLLSNILITAMLFTGLFTGVYPDTALGYSIFDKPTAAGGNITTIAGGGDTLNDGAPATNAKLDTPYATAFDSNGNMYIADMMHHRVRKVDATTGVITTVAGNGTAGYSGNGGQATSAQLNKPTGVVVDSAGNLYISEFLNHCVRKVDTSGIITTIAGDGTAAYSGDGGQAVNARLNMPIHIAKDAADNLYVSDLCNYRIRKISTNGIITTVVGDGTAGFSGDGGMATSAQINQSTDIAFDAAGNLYFCDMSNNRIRKVDTTGVITTIAGTGTAGHSGDYGPAISAQLNNPYGLDVDAFGNVYLSEFHYIRMIDGDGIIATVAGNGTAGFSGDGGSAINAALYYPVEITISSAGQLYISESGNHRIRMISLSKPVITTMAGGGNTLNDGEPATNAQLNQPYSTAFDSNGNMYIADCFNHRVRKVDAATGVITTFAGTGTAGYTGNGGQAASAQLNMPTGVVVDSADNLYISDFLNHCIRKVDTSGVITTIAGGGTAGYSGDGGPAVNAMLNLPIHIAKDAAGNLYVSEGGNHCIRKISTSGIITTFAGNGTQGFSGDGGAATSAQINVPAGIAFDAAGNLYFCDVFNNRVRKVNTAGVITTIAGTGTAGYSGDNGSALSAQLNTPSGVEVDVLGNIYISDNHCIRMIDGSGIITTIAGNGSAGFSGDDGPAKDAVMNASADLTFNSAGHLYICELGSHHVRMISPGVNRYYVSTTGSDNNPGTYTQPFRTINHAAQVAHAGDTVVIRSGTYRETITPLHTGTLGNPITFCAYPGETPTISGAESAGTTGWTEYAIKKDGVIYRKPLTMSLGEGNQVFIDGTQSELARWPNKATTEFDPYDTGAEWERTDSITTSTITDSKLASFDFSLAGCNLITSTSVNALSVDWAINGTTITSHTAGSNMLSFNSANMSWGYFYRYSISGKLELLDIGNEWYCGDGYLYLMTPAGDTPANYNVEYKARKLAFDMGTKQYINIVGLNIFAATIDASQADYCVIDGINAEYVSHHIWTGDTNGNINYEKAGILLGGTGSTIKNSTVAYSTGPLVSIKGSDNTVFNNMLHDGAYGAAANTDNALIKIKGVDHLISNNTAHGAGRTCIGGNFYNCRIQYNDLYDGMKNTYDGGVLYIGFGDFGNSEIHHNLIHDSYPTCGISGTDGVNGIYLDNAVRNILVYKNVIWNIWSGWTCAGFNQSACFQLIYNNTMGSYIPGISGAKGEGTPQEHDTYGSRIINNIVFNGIDDSGTSYHFNNLIYYDPLFVNPASDLRIQESSPAKDSGVAIAGITDGSIGAPDMGAYEFGQTKWEAGCNLDNPPAPPTFETAPAEYKNLLKNNGFEMGNVYANTDHDFDDWTKTGAGTALVNEAEWALVPAPVHVRSGYYGVELPGAVNGNGIEQTVTGLTPNTTYELSGWFRMSAAGDGVTYGVKDYGGSETSITESGISWVFRKLRFTTGATNTSATVFVSRGANSSNSAYIDDLGLALPPPPSTYNLTSAWQANTYLYEDNGQVKYGGDMKDDDRAKWVIEYYDGYQRIRNLSTGHYINNKNLNSYLECTTIAESDTSSQWSMLPVTYNMYQFFNRWKNPWTMHIENLTGYAECSTNYNWCSYWVPVALH